MFVCVCVFVYVCVCVCMFVHVCACVRMYVSAVLLLSIRALQ